MRRFLLAESDEQINMISAWKDQLYCTILKNGTLSLRVRKEMYSDGSWWFNARKGIKTPKQFIDAYSGIDEIDADSWDFHDQVLQNLYSAHPKFAAILDRYVDLDWNGSGDELDILFINFTSPFFLKSQLELPKTLEKGSSVFSNIYRYAKDYFIDQSTLPWGAHNISEEEVVFPEQSNYLKGQVNKLVFEWRITQHMSKCEWEEINRTRLQSSVNEWRYAKIEEFCRNYFFDNGELPLGEFAIDNSVVKFA